MPPPVDSVLPGLPSPSSPEGSHVSWFVVIAGCLYFVSLGVGFEKVIQPFSKLFAGLGVELPLPTRILLSSHSWLLPILFIGAAMLTVAKRLAHFSRRQLHIVNAALILIGLVLPALIMWTLYMPLFALIGRLEGAH